MKGEVLELEAIYIERKLAGGNYIHTIASITKAIFNNRLIVKWLNYYPLFLTSKSRMIAISNSKVSGWQQINMHYSCNRIFSYKKAIFI